MKRSLPMILVASVAIATFFAVRAVKAADAVLTPAAPPADWAFYGALAVIALLGVGLVWLWRHHPGAVATAQADAAKAVAAAKVGAADLTALGDRIVKAIQEHAAAVSAGASGTATAAPADAPATVTPPAGKQGVAGVLSVQVTGDPKVDLPAITAAYLS